MNTNNPPVAQWIIDAFAASKEIKTTGKWQLGEGWTIIPCGGERNCPICAAHPELHYAQTATSSDKGSEPQ